MLSKNEIITGIYCFTNKINNKKYIGQSINIINRYYHHKYNYLYENHNKINTVFYDALRKYGFNMFDFKILEECPIAELDQREKYWISFLNTQIPNGYNVEGGGRYSKQFTSQRIAKPRRNRLRHSNDINRVPNSFTCSICGKILETRRKYCQECLNRIIHEHRPDKQIFLKDEEINISLIDEILNTSMEATAKSLGYTSGNALKKRLKKNGYPTNRSDMLRWYKEETGDIHPSELDRLKREQERYQRHLKRNLSKEIYQIDEVSSQIVNKYASLREAVRKSGFSNGSICRCLQSGKSYNGYLWRYCDENDEYGKKKLPSD